METQRWHNWHKQCHKQTQTTPQIPPPTQSQTQIDMTQIPSSSPDTIWKTETDTDTCTTIMQSRSHTHLQLTLSGYRMRPWYDPVTCAFLELLLRSSSATFSSTAPANGLHIVTRAGFDGVGSVGGRALRGSGGREGSEGSESGCGPLVSHTRSSLAKCELLWPPTESLAYSFRVDATPIQTSVRQPPVISWEPLWMAKVDH